MTEEIENIGSLTEEMLVEFSGLQDELNKDTAISIITGLAKKRKEVMDSLDRLDVQVNELKKARESIDQGLISALLSANMKSFSVENIGTVTIKKEEFPQFNKASVTEIVKKLKEISADDLVFETVRDSEFRHWWNQRVEEIETDYLIDCEANEQIPEINYGSNKLLQFFGEIVKIYRKNSIGFRRK